VSDFLGLEGRTILVTGVANKKSVAFHVSQQLREAGARVIHAVRSPELARDLEKLIGPALVCDVERQAEIDALAAELARSARAPRRLVHSIAFANYGDGPKPFHETARRDFLQAIDVSCFSLVALAQALRPAFAPQASVVALSISDTRMAAESYGFMAPVKAALDSTVVFLAKSFSADSQVRFNAVKAGPLKTSRRPASRATSTTTCSPRRRPCATARSRPPRSRARCSSCSAPRSSGVNAQGLLVDAGMSVNYFDREIVRRYASGASEARRERARRRRAGAGRAARGARAARRAARRRARGPGARRRGARRRRARARDRRARRAAPRPRPSRGRSRTLRVSPRPRSGAPERWASTSRTSRGRARNAWRAPSRRRSWSCSTARTPRRSRACGPRRRPCSSSPASVSPSCRTAACATATAPAGS
jgi:enoyl-[acyl-carrier protein] reductase I